MNEKNGAFMSRLEDLHFYLSKTGSVHPSTQADVIRNMYIHLTEGKDNIICEDQSGWLPECDKIHEMYADVVDNMDEAGLNNFAAGALSLCHYYKNESSKWQTSLSTDNILQIMNHKDEHSSERGTEDNSQNLVIPILRNQVANTCSGPNPSHNSVHHDAVLTPINQRPIPTNSSVNYTSPSIHMPQNHISLCKQNTTDFYRRNHAQSKSNTDNGTFNQPDRPNFVLRGSHYADDGPQSSFKHDKEYVNVSPSRVGGPYANFGQKPKKGQNVPWKSNPRKSQTEEEEDFEKPLPFKTAREQLIINQQKKFGNSHNSSNQVTSANYGSVKKSLGTRRGPTNKFVPPVIGQDSDDPEASLSHAILKKDQRSSNSIREDEMVDERLKGIDPNMIELIKNDIMDTGSRITWSDIAGLEFAKKTIQEIVVWPMLRPDIFTGLRGPPKGLLLFGPPGTGKTLIGKCIASQSKSTFFCISASSLTSKWVGEGEKMVRALFAVARCSQPAVVFIDEVDSLLSQRSDSEHESSRRIKTEFLVQLDGASTASDERLLVIGATNRPQEIDEAARRRFVKRLLIPLPEAVARKQIVLNLTAQQSCHLSESDLKFICDKTDGYSGADMSNLCREAALGPIRSIPLELMETITPDQVRSMQLEDFEQALLQVRASVSSKDLELYHDWNKTYGSFGH